MNKSLTVAMLCLAFVFLPSCDQQQTTGADTLLKNTMAIHDEAMKEMAEMNRIGRLLRRDTVHIAAGRADSVQAVLQQMKNAEEGMYEWMRQYAAPTNLAPEAAKTYLDGQYKAISQNQQDIRAARDAGKQLLGH